MIVNGLLAGKEAFSSEPKTPESKTESKKGRPKLRALFLVEIANVQTQSANNNLVGIAPQVQPTFWLIEDETTSV